MKVKPIISAVHTDTIKLLINLKSSFCVVYHIYILFYAPQECL